MTKDEMTARITQRICATFRCFGEGISSTWGNPIAEALKDNPLMFAAGVDVAEVVRFVIDDAAAMNDKRPVAFRVQRKTGTWYVTGDEQEAADVADGGNYQGLYTREGA